MPLYEGPISDKQAVVIDIGAKYTKFGFTGDYHPRCIVPTEVMCPKKGQLRPVLSYQNEDDLYALLVEFIQLLYFKHVLVSPKDRRIVIIESLLCPTVFRDTLARVLFRHFEVCSVLFVPSHLATLCTLGVGTGLIVDIGYQEALLIPVYEGVPVLKAWQAQPLAANTIEQRIKSQLGVLYNDNKNRLTDAENKIYTSNFDSLSDETIEDIKVRACFVTTMERGRQLGEGVTPSPEPPDLKYWIEGEKELTVPGQLRESAFEVLFEKDNDQMSLPNMMLDAILKCAIDMRRPLAENIVLIGGTAMATGFKSRLLSELNDLVKAPRYADTLHIPTFKLHQLPAKENCAAWLGGAIFGATDAITQRSLSKEAYLNLKSVPDWSNLIHNRPDYLPVISRLVL